MSKDHDEEKATGSGMCGSTKLTKLYVRLEKISEDINRMRIAFEEGSISLDPLQIQCRLEVLNSYIEKAMALQSEIDVLDPDNSDRAALEETCVITKALYMSAATNRSPQPYMNSAPTHHHSNFPKLKLPKFSGKHADYKQFISLFESLVDSDPSLSNIEKFNHLISCLSDEALGTVKAFQMSKGVRKFEEGVRQQVLNIL
ncbi:uncharacterized protein LOC121405335 [Drosophila obscura]|uniref:uncharacterized protein LOC121405335 n=1 Tax=Drosophila obscura TaxID=7282 RepID=UPI001BB2210E|nr:uncharacterized protein LOC121405335 [Drosophila obscura]